MPRFSKTVAAGALLAGAALASSGCVDNESSLFVYGVFALGRTQCLAQPDATAVLLPSGTLDLALTDSYEATLLVGSQLTQRGSREALRTETSRLHIDGAHITLYGTDGSVQSPPDAAATGLVPPASGTDPGLAAVSAQLIRPQDVAGLGPDGQAIARIRLFGTTLGGQDIESGDYDFPITVCHGCLVVYPPAAIASGTCDPAVDIGQEVTVCNPGQDDFVPCTFCTSNPVCQTPP